jgi:hypothetical protein
MSTYLCALRDEAKALNTIAHQGLLGHGETKLFQAEDFENDEPLVNTMAKRERLRATTCKAVRKLSLLMAPFISGTDSRRQLIRL